MNLIAFVVVLAFVIMITAAVVITGSGLPLLALVFLRDILAAMFQLQAYVSRDDETEVEPSSNMGFMKD